MHHKTHNKRRGRLFALALAIMIFLSTTGTTAIAAELTDSGGFSQNQMTDTTEEMTEAAATEDGETADEENSEDDVEENTTEKEEVTDETTDENAEESENKDENEEKGEESEELTDDDKQDEGSEDGEESISDEDELAEDVLSELTAETEEAEELEEILEEDALAEEENQISTQSDLVIEVPDVNPPTTYQEVYDRIMAYQEILPNGMRWDDNTPYGPLGPLGDAYYWKGGVIANNVDQGRGCAAFAFLLSDVGFGSLPARTYTTGNFTLADVKVGDILRVNFNTHSVIVLKVTSAGVVVAEANLHDRLNGIYEGIVHWGRTMTEAEVLAADYLVTRYPTNFTSTDEEGANDTVGSGNVGSLTWKITKSGTLTISGNGALPDNASEAWSDFSDSISTIVIENGVTSIGSNAFYNSNALSVSIPNTVSSIGASAFRNSKIISVNIPGSVKTIGDSAFRECANLATVTTNEGLTTVGGNAFRGSQKLISISLPSTITTMGAGAFYDCIKLRSAEFAPSNNTVKMGDNLFTRCWDLRYVTLPSKFDRISTGMFQVCNMLTSLYIPAGIEEISCVANTTPFDGSGLQYIGFGGSEAEWKKITGASKTPSTITMFFDVSPGEEPPSVEPEPSGHTHAWATAWSSDKDNHWHECTADGCDIVNNAEKDGFAAHTGEWVVEKEATAEQAGSKYKECPVCKYRETALIPATGSTAEEGGDDDKQDEENKGNTGSENTGSDDTGNSGTGSGGTGTGDSGTGDSNVGSSETENSESGDSESESSGSSGAVAGSGSGSGSVNPENNGATNSENSEHKGSDSQSSLRSLTDFMNQYQASDKSSNSLNSLLVFGNTAKTTQPRGTDAASLFGLNILPESGLTKGTDGANQSPNDAKTAEALGEANENQGQSSEPDSLAEDSQSQNDRDEASTEGRQDATDNGNGSVLWIAILILMIICGLLETNHIRKHRQHSGEDEFDE